MKVVMGHGLIWFQQTPCALDLLCLSETSSRREASAVSIIFRLPTLYAWVACGATCCQRRRLTYSESRRSEDFHRSDKLRAGKMLLLVLQAA